MVRERTQFYIEEMGTGCQQNPAPEAEPHWRGSEEVEQLALHLMVPPGDVDINSLIVWRRPERPLKDNI